MKVKKVIEYLLLLALAGVLLYFSFKGVRWSDFVEGLSSCNFYWIACSMTIGITGFIIRALRWQLLLKPLDSGITLKQSYNGVAIAYLTNFAVPRAGEIARCAVVARDKRITFEGALGTVVVERSIDLVCLIFWTAITMLIKWDMFGGFIRNELIEPFASKFTPGMLLILSVILLLLFTGCCIIYRLRKRAGKNKLIAKLAKIAKGLVQGLKVLINMKEKWLFLLYTLLLWGTYWATSFTTICAFPSVSSLNAADALFLMIVGSLGWVVPVQGGLGAFHFIVSLALASVYAVPQTTGVIFATISHESQALAMIICGVAALFTLWKSGHEKEIK